MTSEAPQDVAALPSEPESPIVQAWNAWRRSPEGADGSRAEAFVAGWQAAANPTVVLGLLDQNDRLRSALRDANQIIAMTRQHLAADHPDCAYTALGVMNDATRATLADGIDAALSSGRGSGAEEAAPNG